MVKRVLDCSTRCRLTASKQPVEGIQVTWVTRVDDLIWFGSNSEFFLHGVILLLSPLRAPGGRDHILSGAIHWRGLETITSTPVPA
jgi:hypothetical protein